MSEEGYQPSYDHGRDVEEAWPSNGREPEEEEEVEEDERDTLKMTRGRAFSAAVAGKEPWAPVEYMEPDLAEYFSGFEGLSEASMVAICRTFANYLAAKQRREPVKRRKRVAYREYEEAP